MKVAFFTPYLPYPRDTGGKIRSYYLLRALTEKFEVDLYTVYYDQKPSEDAVCRLEEHCRKVILFRLVKSWRTRDRLKRVISPLPRLIDHFFTPCALEQALNWLNDERYELLIADEICMTPYVEQASHRPRVVTRQKIDHIHYLELARRRPLTLEKFLDWVEAIKLRRYERKKMPLYQGAVVCSEIDARWIRRDAPELPLLIIPNGVDLETFAPSGRSRAEQPTLLYVGTMNYYPNVDAIRFFFSDIYPSIRGEIPDVRVVIVGHNPPPEIRRLSHIPKVEVTGSVPDVRPYYEMATVFIVPLRLGGGTRLKILEAMAMGLPVVSTAVGAEGLDVHPGEDILIADDPASFALSVLRLLKDPELYQRLVKGGQRLARRYDWRELTKPLPEFVKEIATQWRKIDENRMVN